jgi:hypothetical protein
VRGWIATSLHDLRKRIDSKVKIAAAIYAAENWSIGKSKEEIWKEIEHIKSMWLMGRDFQFPGSAAYQYSREMRLREILADPG